MVQGKSDKRRYNKIIKRLMFMMVCMSSDEEILKTLGGTQNNVDNCNVKVYCLATWLGALWHRFDSHPVENILSVIR